MATSKTLKPTNTTISIPAMSDRPNQSVNSNCIDKLSDAVNDVFDNKTARKGASWSPTLTTAVNGASGILTINSQFFVIVWVPAVDEISVFVFTESGMFRKSGTGGSVSFGLTADANTYTITRNGNEITVTRNDSSNQTYKFYT